ncbi:3-phosphoshikimate 1-carboxyvinyltransferase [Melghiribacillus thermohalophilus]|uniref:3-phosphoshikimate 1-carboxyvinyltransferase n=1 Tax=Melghiribacillus thermohalophilus TaxID=1324956 RepID=A0A4R3NA92_9BACI|nr:3-phosphoshikimate 1-carboxyvinyltransferase [Melghiribacillus thermohalophilus]TCT25570.1 3-phosphoshikimate 1-carboxyvinyltransferase [Melghiribacillus thermohalophilus]
MERTLTPINHPLTGTLEVPGDKSISHRAVILGSLSRGTTVVENFLDGEDCLSTVNAFKCMGVNIRREGTTLSIEGRGLDGLKEPPAPLNLGNSGTTSRLLLGVLAGQPFHACLTGDESLSRRPMDRVADPLREMGAAIDGREKGKYFPISIRGTNLNPITYTLPVHSAQVKSAILLAGLFAEGRTTVIEPVPTRDHTERILPAFGGEIKRNGQYISIEGGQELKGTRFTVPGDLSSAAFFITASALVQGSDLTIKHVGLNPTRTGIIDLLKQMGAPVETKVTEKIGEEPVGDIRIQGSPLKGMKIEGEVIPRVIDEIPLIALAATQANGVTEIRDAKELRYKETDRIQAVVDVLTKIGADIQELKDGMVINGPVTLKGGTVSSYHDHRIGMMAAIASFISEGPVTIEHPSCINISYPQFFHHLNQLKQE